MTTPQNPQPGDRDIDIAATRLIRDVRRQGFPGPGQRQLMQDQRSGQFYWNAYAGMGDSMAFPVSNPVETAAIARLLGNGTFARTYDYRDYDARYTMIELYSDMTWIAVGGTATAAGGSDTTKAGATPEIVILVARGANPAHDFIVTPAKDDPAALRIARSIPGNPLAIFPFGDYCRLPDGRIGRHILVDEAQRNLYARRIDSPEAGQAATTPPAPQSAAPQPARTAFAARPDLL